MNFYVDPARMVGSAPIDDDLPRGTRYAALQRCFSGWVLDSEQSEQLSDLGKLVDDPGEPIGIGFLSGPRQPSVDIVRQRWSRNG